MKRENIFIKKVRQIVLMTNQKRSMIFIDAGNLFSAWWTYCKQRGFIKKDEKTGKESFTQRLSYQKLIKELSEDTDFIRGYYYDAAPEPIGKKQDFYDMLRQNEITIVTKQLRYKAIVCRHC